MHSSCSNDRPRGAIPELLALTELVDLCIPRGGEGLIRDRRVLARSGYQTLQRHLQRLPRRGR